VCSASQAHCAELKAVFRFYCVPTLRERNELTVSRAQVLTGYFEVLRVLSGYFGVRRITK
jgi:hypothetical protein